MDDKKYIEFAYQGKTHQVAQSWDALSSNEYLRAINCLFSSQELKLTPIEVKIILAEIICKQQPYEFVNLKELINADDDESLIIYNQILAELLKITDFAISRQGDSNSYAINYHRFKLWKEIKEIHCEADKWFAPAEDLSNLTFWEWTRCCIQYEAYVNHVNKSEFAAADAALDILLGILWRPKGIIGATTEDVKDIRQPYYKHELQAITRGEVWRKGRIDSPDEQYIIRQALLFWFQSNRQRIIGMYPYAFSQGNSGGIERNYAETLVAIAGSYDTSSLGVTNLHNVLTQLSLDGKRAEEAKQNIKNV